MAYTFGPDYPALVCEDCAYAGGLSRWSPLRRSVLATGVCDVCKTEGNVARPSRLGQMNFSLFKRLPEYTPAAPIKLDYASLSLPPFTKPPSVP